jgi:hypothetical protein
LRLNVVSLFSSFEHFSLVYQNIRLSLGNRLRIHAIHVEILKCVPRVILLVLCYCDIVRGLKYSVMLD